MDKETKSKIKLFVQDLVRSEPQSRPAAWLRNLRQEYGSLVFKTVGDQGASILIVTDKGKVVVPVARIRSSTQQDV